MRMYPPPFISSLNENASPYSDANLAPTTVQPTSFEDLSDDIVLEIFYLLDLRSILRLRGTNWRLRTLSTTYSIWSGALQHLHKACPSRGFLDLERPLSSYSSLQVEQMVTRAVRVEEGWRQPILTPTRIRKFRRMDGQYAGQCLPGGRWLLLASSTAAEGLDYYDLESEPVVPRNLFPSDVCIGDGIPDDLAIDIKAGEPLLSFHLGLIVRNPHKIALGVRNYTLSFWKVTLDPDYEGLTSTHLKTVKFSSGTETGTRNTMALSGGLLVRITWLRRRVGFEALEWDFADSWRKAVFVPPTETHMASDLHLLPGRRLLVVFTDEMCIYDVPELAQVESPSDPVPEVTWEPAWRYPFGQPSDRSMLAASRPFQTTGSAFVAMLFSSRAIHRFTIPTVGDVGVETFLTNPENGGSYLMACLDRSRGIWWHTFSRRRGTGTFSWAPVEECRELQAFAGSHQSALENPSCEEFTEGKIELRSLSRKDPWFFDERAGRAVMPLDDSDDEEDGFEFAVLDLV